MKIKRVATFCLLAITLLLSLAAAPPAQAQQLTDDDVEQAIQRIKSYLYDAQHASGAWYGAYHQGPNDGVQRDHWGPTAMAILALIVSGESPQHPDIAKGLELLERSEVTGVYVLSLRAHVWSYLPDEFRGALSRDTDIMLRSAYDLSRFNYLTYNAPGFNDPGQPGPTGRIDNSTTQYGLLALWQASKRGLNVPNGFWADAAESFLNLQSRSDGGWSYGGGGNTTQSMTLAGLTCMYVAQQQLHRGLDRPNAQFQDSISRGLAYLDRNFQINAGTHGGDSYMWYGYERVGLASGRKYFGNHDWFQEIARVIVDRKGNYGNSVHTAAFDLMFLARGRVPVWINKLEVSGAAWNNRPNDVYFLNRFISDYREHEVNWQVVGIDGDPREWISAPLMWFSTDGEVAWTDEQVAKIKQYIDLGGTLILNPESRDSQARQSFEELVSRIYPELELVDLPADHPMANLLIGDPRNRKAPPVRVVSNGARVLVVVPKEDWGKVFQSDDKPDPERTEAWRYITNIYGVATDRGELTPRLSSPLVPRYQHEETGTIKVVIPQWQDPAGVLPETDVYRMMRNYLHNQTGKQLVVETIPLTDLASADPSLLHLVGTTAVEVKPEERDAIKAYLDAGGTILVENLGGAGDFVKSIREQLGTMFPGDEDRVSTARDIITGRNLPEGSKNNRRVVYRRLVLERANPDSRLLMRGYDNGTRVPVLISYEDLSLGMLGVKQYGINGYSVETSRDLMVNILLEANKAHPGAAAQPASTGGAQ